MEEFLTSTLAALEDPAVVERYRLIFEPMFRELLDPVTRKLSETVQALTTKISSLQAQSNAKDEKIASLQKEVGKLQVLVDNHEQHGRRDSIRIFGLSESTPGSTDDKVPRLCNVRMKLQPPLEEAEDVYVSHRVGKPPEPPDEGTPAPIGRYWLNSLPDEQRTGWWWKERDCATNNPWWRRQLRCRLTPRSLSGTGWRLTEQWWWRRWWTQQQHYELAWW